MKCHICVCVAELSNTEEDNLEEEVPQATPAGNTPQETQSKRRKKKTQSKKQLEGKCCLLSTVHFNATVSHF